MATLAQHEMLRFRNYIGGEWCDAATGETFVTRNPARSDEAVAEYPKGAGEDARRAFQAAAQALENWRRLPAPRRGEYLFRAAEWLDRRLDQIAAEMTREEGKTLKEARGETQRAINIFRYFGGEGARLAGETVPSERDQVFCFTIRKPRGVVSLITPWNFPVAIPAWKMAPALICGNTVVIKPASLAPSCAARLIEALHEAGMPPGVLNLVTGPGSTVGEEMLANEHVRALSFTGSCAVGEHLSRCAQPRKLPAQLEMGGKNPTIVCADADLEYAAATVVNAAFFSTGQKCTATSRCIVEAGVYDRFRALLVEKTKALKVGDGMDPSVDMGPCVDQAQMNTVLDYIELGKKEGFPVLCGGGRLTGPEYGRGFFLAPTIFDQVDAASRLAQEEIFGPVLALMSAANFDDALRLANSVRFGLSASLLTRDVSKIFRYINDIEAGLITVNLPSAGVEYQLPFGGVKDSSSGFREQGSVAIDFYSELCTIYLKY
jgi:acyl-CoA reductase-like NAD-dependent aldehyde dehydrogenase